MNKIKDVVNSMTWSVRISAVFLLSLIIGIFCAVTYLNPLFVVICASAALVGRAIYKVGVWSEYYKGKMSMFGPNEESKKFIKDEYVEKEQN